MSLRKFNFILGHYKNGKKLSTYLVSYKTILITSAPITEPCGTSKRYYTVPAGVPGAGAGKGGGGGGSVRESGGGLGKYGAAQEEGYFHAKQREQLQKMKKEMKDNPNEVSPKEEK